MLYTACAGVPPKYFSLATVSVLFAARYKAVESKAASMLLVSTLTLAITVPAILRLSNDSETELQLATASRVEHNGRRDGCYQLPCARRALRRSHYR